MNKHVCKGEHKGHLCVLASQGEIEKMKGLVSDPAFICFNCGRVSRCEGNLCNPMPLK